MTNLQLLALDSDIADLQRIIDADEAILKHEPSGEKRDGLSDEICKLQQRIDKLKLRRERLLAID